jgi:hypothetical protein
VANTLNLFRDGAVGFIESRASFSLAKLTEIVLDSGSMNTRLKIPTPSFLIALACFGLSPSLKAVDCPSDCDNALGQTALGFTALSVNTGFNNTGVGQGALQKNTTGSFNVAIGGGALLNNTTGQQNMAIGAEALRDSSNGNFNMAIGFRALFLNTGNRNSAVGAAALRNNTTASDNTAIGSNAMRENTTGDLNTAIGSAAMMGNTTGQFNTAIGANAMTNGTGNANTAVGSDALSSTRGDFNTATGDRALFFNDSGSQNTAVGEGALLNSTGDNNTALGDGAGNAVTTASNVTCIGANVLGVNVSNTTWIGGVYGSATQNGTTAPVIVSADGQLGTVASSERFKKDIATMEKASEAILSLRPVTFHYKTDTKDTPQFGLVAEEVAKVNSALVLPDKEGKPYSVRYDAVNAMLLNEFLKEHEKTEKLEATVASLIATVREQAAQIQKVSAQLEASKPAPQVVNNP